ncbi:MAG TPA: hypothetical protein VF593_00810 [Chthoniobacteraceae bacterium]|jgi:hypothetical protein
MPRPKLLPSTPERRGPGRPKSSPLDPAAQARERQQRLRERKREAGRVVAQIWIDAKWHEAILKTGTLQDAADEAFALLMAKRRGKSH